MELIPHRLFGNLRATVVEEIPWFCGKDIAAALAYTKPRNALKRHVSENQMCIYETLREAMKGGPKQGPLQICNHTQSSSTRPGCIL